MGGIAVHEGYPGHHLQHSYAHRNLSIYRNNPMAGFPIDGAGRWSQFRHITFPHSCSSWSRSRSTFRTGGSYGLNSYSRPAVTLAHLENLLGPERFQDGIGRWGVEETIPIDLPRAAASTSTSSQDPASAG